MEFFVIEGLDGSGKSTQIELLKKYLEQKNIKYKYIHFPRTNYSIYGNLISRFLRGDLGKLNDVNPYLVALIYAGDRKDASEKIMQWQKENYIIILDRYVHSNIAFQCAKLNSKKEKIELKDWINQLEYNYNKIPKPESSIFLDVPLSFTKEKLSNQRKGDDRNYLEGKIDIHEASINFQSKVRDIYLWQVKEDKNFHLINCDDGNGNMLDAHDILSKIIKQFNLE